MKLILLFCSINMHGGVDSHCLNYMVDCADHDKFTTCQYQYLLITDKVMGDCFNPALKEHYPGAINEK